MSVLTPSQIAALLARDNPIGAVGSPSGLVSPVPAAVAGDTTNLLTWCDFCKGHYNEYHFGEPEGGDIS